MAFREKQPKEKQFKEKQLKKKQRAWSLSIVHETRLKKNLTRDDNSYNFVNSILKQQAKTAIFGKQLKNVKMTKNRSRSSKPVNKGDKDRFSFIRNINPEQSSVLDQESSLSNFPIIWIPLGLDSPPNETAHIIYNVKNFKVAALYRLGILLKELRWHMNEIRRL